MIAESADKQDYKNVSELQIEMNEKMNTLEYLYTKYKNNRV